jgi:uncharacterized protein (DUF342 family)
VSVASVYRTRGDVGVATGHITFVGSVVIAGDINPGFRVHADGDVEVQGTVNGGQIEAGGNVSVRYGIKHHARVVASGSIKAKFVEFSEVKAGAQVWVSDGIVQSNVEAGGRVEVLGRNGSIVGGHVVARFGVSARELGSVRGVPTCIEVGVAPELEGMLQRLSDEALALGRQAELYRARLRYLAQQSSAGHLTQYGAKEVRKLLAELQDTTMQQARIAGRQQALGETQLAILRAEVEAHDRCHADVQIRVGSGQCAVSKTRRRVRFRRSERAHEVDAVSI